MSSCSCIRLAVHLQHLSTTPTFIAAARHDKPPLWRGSETASDDRFHEPVQWRMFARVCTAPVKYDPGWRSSSGDRDRRAAWVVTGARLHVAAHDVLHLRLLYAELPGCAVVQSRWARGAARLAGKSGLLSAAVSSAGSSGGGSGGSGSHKERQQPGKPEGGVNIDSGVLPGGPPVPAAAQKMLRLVDTSQVTMGPQDSPGYWLVTGARLDVDNGRISLHVKFSLLAPGS